MAEYFEETSETLNLSDEITGLLALYTADVDTLVFSENVHGVYVCAAPLTDRGDYSDVVVGSVDAILLTDNLVLGDTLELLGGIDAASLTDTLALNDTPASVVVATSALSDMVVSSDAIGAGFAISLTDALVVSEVLATSATVETSEWVAFSDSIASSLMISGVSSDTLLARDEIGYGFIKNVADALVATDSIAGTIAVYSPVLTDTVVANEVLTGPVASYAALPTDTLVGSDTLAGALTLVGVLSDTVLFGDTLADTAYQTLVVVNAETGAVSTYTMTPTVAGLAEYRGTLYLAGPQGLYAMDSTEDEEGEVVWTLRTGFSNLGSDLLKRVRDVNVQGRTEGSLTVQAITDRYGQKQEHHYLLPALTRDSYRDGVCKIGKGLSSVYWALGLQGQGPAEVDQLRVAVEPLSRRR